jgi:hypothetical protein
MHRWGIQSSKDEKMMICSIPIMHMWPDRDCDAFHAATNEYFVSFLYFEATRLSATTGPLELREMGQI